MSNVIEAMLRGLSLEDLAKMEREAERDFRQSKTLQELASRQAEWRAIETVYLKRLGEVRA